MFPFQHYPAFFLTTRPRVSPDFLEEARNALYRVPLFLLQELSRKGWRVVLVWHMLDAFRELRHITPRGWRNRTTMSYLDGMCYSMNEAVVLAEHFINVHTNRWERASRVPYVLLHEVGHAVDSCWGMLSKKKAFKKAWLKDIRALKRCDRRRLQYSIQYNSAAGRSEAFANVFTALLGEGGDSAYMLRCFPNTARYIQETVLLPSSLVYHRPEPPLPLMIDMEQRRGEWMVWQMSRHTHPQTLDSRFAALQDGDGWDDLTGEADNLEVA